MGKHHCMSKNGEIAGVVKIAIGLRHNTTFLTLSTWRDCIADFNADEEVTFLSNPSTSRSKSLFSTSRLFFRHSANSAVKLWICPTGWRWSSAHFAHTRWMVPSGSGSASLFKRLRYWQHVMQNTYDILYLNRLIHFPTKTGVEFKIFSDYGTMGVSRDCWSDSLNRLKRRAL